MRSVKSLFVMVALCGALALLSGISSAEMGSGAWKEYHQAQIKLLQDSAAALKSSSPKLSKALSKFAHEEEEEIGEAREKEVEGKKEEKDEKHAQANIQVLRDSAKALKASNPELSAGLIKIADDEAKEELSEQQEDSNEMGTEEKEQSWQK